MSNINEIILAIDSYLELQKIDSINPVVANEILEQKGLLKDSKNRRGLSLRRLLRDGEISYAYQLGGKYSKWIIPHSNTKLKKQKFTSN